MLCILVNLLYFQNFDMSLMACRYIKFGMYETYEVINSLSSFISSTF